MKYVLSTYYTLHESSSLYCAVIMLLCNNAQNSAEEYMPDRLVQVSNKLLFIYTKSNKLTVFNDTGSR